MGKGGNMIRSREKFNNGFIINSRRGGMLPPINNKARNLTSFTKKRTRLPPTIKQHKNFKAGNLTSFTKEELIKMVEKCQL